MKKNLLEFLYGVSQQESEIDDVLDQDFAALLEKADAEEAEAMKAEKTPLSAALKAIGITGEALHEDPDGFCLITDDRETYFEACRKLSEPDNMHTLAVKGWVATHGGDQAQANELPQFKIKFLEITTTEGDGESNKEKGEDLSAIIKAGREFATEEPEHDDELSPVEHDAPDGNKLKKVTLPKATDGEQPKGKIKDSSAHDIVANMLEDCGVKHGKLKKPADGGKVPHAFKKPGKKK
jgi:hypothetical protein